MHIHSFNLARWNRVSTGLGGAFWIALALASLSGWIVLDDLQLLLLLALFVIAPIAVSLVTTPVKNRLFELLFALVLFLQPFASLIGGASFLFSVGLLAAAVAFVWFLFTVLIALTSATLLVRKSSIATVGLAGALMYLPIGGAWMVLARSGIQPLGFGVHTDMLTALHFHFIPLAALLMIGLTGRAIQAMQGGIVWKSYQVLTVCMLINPLLVATGITMTQLVGGTWLQSIAACLLAGCMILIALFTLRFIVPTTTSPSARILLLLSSSTVVFTMLAAGAYALGGITRWWTITIPQMVLVHGWVNALIFGLCGLAGWRLRGSQEKE